MVRGTVVFFHDEKNYGFIEPKDGDTEDEDVFFHMEDVEGPDLEEDQEVEFEVTGSKKGPRATNVTRIV
jgi:CspA family cold shock protein